MGADVMAAKDMRDSDCAAGGVNRFKGRVTNQTLFKVAIVCAALMVSFASQATSTPSAAASAASGATSAASVASEGPATAVGSIDLPPPGRGEGRTYRIDFRPSEDKVRKLVLDHKARCEALGPARCRVEEFSPERLFDGQSQQLVLRLAPGQAQVFIGDIGKATLDSGFTDRRDQQDAPRYDATEDSQLKIVLLEVQRQKLEALKVGASGARLSLIQRNLAQVEIELASFKQQQSQQTRPSEAEKLTIGYGAGRDYPKSRLDGQFEQLSGMFWVSLLVVTGVAVLTAIYFGIIGFALLGLKRLAIKAGLMKD